MSYPARASSLADRLSVLPWNRFHTVVVLLFGMGWALDGFEVTLIGNLLGALRQRFHLDAEAMSLILAAWFVGLMLGSAGFGQLADHYGRRRVFLAGLVLYGIATLATALAPDLAALLGLRLVAGIGVGAEYSAINAAITELVPTPSRGRAAAMVLNFWPLGSLIALSTAWFRRHLPESPRWLESTGRVAAAEALVGGIEAGLTRLPVADAAPIRRPARKKQTAWRMLLRCYSGRLALGALLDFAEAAGYYGLFAFLPLVVLPALNLAPARLPLFYIAGSVGGVAGGIAVATVLDRWGRHRTVGFFHLATAVATVVMAFATAFGRGAIMVGFALVNLLATGSWIAAYPIFSELFPTPVRASGIRASGLSLERIAGEGTVGAG